MTNSVCKAETENPVQKNKWYVNVFIVCLALNTACSTAGTVIRFFRNVYTELIFNWISVFVPLAFSLVLPAALIILALKKSRYFKDVLLLYAFLNIVSAFHISYVVAGVHQLNIGIPALASSILFAFSMLIPFSDKIKSIPSVKYIASAAVVVSQLLAVYVYYASYSVSRISLINSGFMCIIGVCIVFYFCENQNVPACFSEYRPFGADYKKATFLIIPCVLALMSGAATSIVGPTHTTLYVTLNYGYELLTLYIKIFFIVIAVKSIKKKDAAPCMQQ